MDERSRLRASMPTGSRERPACLAWTTRAPLRTITVLRTITLLGVIAALGAITMLLVFFSGAAHAADRWTDIADAEWVADYGVTAEQVAGVAAGYGDGTFRPGLAVGRGHFAKMAAVGLGVPPSLPDTPSFSDVPAADPLYSYIEGAVAAGVISGYGDGTFRPAAPVVQQQAESILGLHLAGEELAETGAIAGDQGDYPSLAAWYAAEGAGALSPFADAASVATAHAPAVAYLVARGVIQGSARGGGLYLDPLGGLTRARAVVLIIRVAGTEVSVPRAIEPFVSTEWLQAELETEGLVVVDLRSAADYAAGHIPGSVSAPFGGDSGWAKPADGLTMELPGDEALFETIGGCGIDAGSRVVLVGGVSASGYPLVDATRVAATLVYAGVENIAILQGGYKTWTAEGRAVATEATVAQPATYSGTVDRELFVFTQYVMTRIGAVTLVDTRSADVYFGVTVEAAAPKAGHIPTAVSLPTSWALETGGTYIAAEVAGAMAAGVVGADKSRPIIVYCTFGGTASVWWYLLSQVLGYRDVKLYDGSAQAWVRDNDMEAYTWGP